MLHIAGTENVAQSLQNLSILLKKGAWERVLMRGSIRTLVAIPLVLMGSYYFLDTSSGGLFQRTYEPSSPEIEQLAIATSMTEKARQIFYKQNPQIAPKQEFHRLCRGTNHNPEKTVLLGCFIHQGGRGNIFIQSVTDSRLQGTIEVVAAHEMLHAAYRNLSIEERKALAPKLLKAAASVTDSFLLPVIQEYEKGPTEIYFNELHSYLGTELTSLASSELETYYQQYFEDRQKVVALSTQSRRVLTQLESQADTLSAEIDRLEASLQQEEQALKSLSSQLDQTSQYLERLKANLIQTKTEAEVALRRGNSSLVSYFEQQQAEYNSEVRYFNTSVEEHRDRVNSFNRNFELYKQKIDTF
ncbi:MAG: hypothetical protein HC810_07750, partial [Acaryochloridaceae cyanobacterium RL_2_7]|nr:hypothetical protein [Acaryochloridaceae cyanobacterium RL_2_7]